MTDLTEQWKNGHLKGFRWYYVKFKTGEIDVCWLTEWSNDELGIGGQCFEGIEDENILEILAPVPSYEEWQAKVEENAQLKELLKECKEMSFGIRLALSSGKINDVFTLTYKIENKINQALGEE